MTWQFKSGLIVNGAGNLPEACEWVFNFTLDYRAFVQGTMKNRDSKFLLFLKALNVQILVKLSTPSHLKSWTFYQQLSAFTPASPHYSPAWKLSKLNHDLYPFGMNKHWKAIDLHVFFYMKQQIPIWSQICKAIKDMVMIFILNIKYVPIILANIK